MDSQANKELLRFIQMCIRDRLFTDTCRWIRIHHRILRRQSECYGQVSLSGHSGSICHNDFLKSINGIYRKTYMKGKTIEQIFEIFAVRVIVNTVNDCYNAVSYTHLYHDHRRRWWYHYTRCQICGGCRQTAFGHQSWKNWVCSGAWACLLYTSRCV